MAQESKSDDKNICTSVFKDGNNTTTSETYTQKWVEIINTLERRKNVNLCEE